jgi:hypothetical protein
MIRQEYKDALTGNVVAVDYYQPPEEFRSARAPQIYHRHVCLRCGQTEVYQVGQAECCRCGSMYLRLDG